MYIQIQKKKKQLKVYILYTFLKHKGKFKVDSETLKYMFYTRIVLIALLQYNTFDCAFCVFFSPSFVLPSFDRLVFPGAHLHFLIKFYLTVSETIGLDT